MTSATLAGGRQPRPQLFEPYSYSYSELPVRQRDRDVHHQKEIQAPLKKRLGPSQSFSRVEGLRKKFEFGARCNVSKSFDDRKDAAEVTAALRHNVSLDSGVQVSSCEDIYDNAKESEKNTSLASSVQRLRNSIFSSLKLPRKQLPPSKMSAQQQMSRLDCSSGRNYANSSQPSSNSSKRKSAVELLAESKAFYVKSETVLDRKQELPLRVNSTLCTGTNAGTHYATLSGRHRKSGMCMIGGEPLQNQLRRLLESTSSQSPNVGQEHRSQTLRYPDRKRSEHRYNWDTTSHPLQGVRSQYNSGTISGNSSSGTSGSKGQIKSDPEHTRSLNRPSSSGDNRIFFPEDFVVPKPSKSDPVSVFANSFSIESPYSSPEKIDARQILSVVDGYDNRNYQRPISNVEYYDDREPIDDYGTISPPAEYAVTERSNYRYTRSNSHSNTTKNNQENPYTMNFNSHKSLPDLHKQPEHYAETGRRLVGIGGSGNYLPGYNTIQGLSVPHQTHAARSNEALSSYSKTTSGRSYRSSSKGSEVYSRRSASAHVNDLGVHVLDRGSTDEVYFYNRSGSSYARDSGGSSGHCSGPVGPPSLRGIPSTSLSLQQRRDSGSSTQHSSTRSHRYSSFYVDQYHDTESKDASSHLEYCVSAPLQFQDGVQFNHLSNATGQLAVNATVSISTNFSPRNDNIRNSNSAHLECQPCQPSDRPALVGIHFQASIPPVQFQDAHPIVYGYNSSYSNEGFHGRRESGTRESRHLLTRRPASSGCNQVISTCYDDEHEGGARSLPYEPEESPPGLGNFKRQRCLRYKHRASPRRPILRSKSDISDRYWRNEDKCIMAQNIEKPRITPPSSDNNSPNHAARIQLDKFFDQLGMDDDTYKEVILKDLKKRRRRKQRPSPSHDLKQDSDTTSKCTDDEANDELSSSFNSSDVSFPDSNLIPNNADYTVQGAHDNKPYRSYEPLSIVERNARIIKWLCNCRKLQAV